MKDGWAEIDGIPSPERVLSLAEENGIITPHPNGEKYNVIKPSDGVASIKGTFSSTYGFEEFPLHTDTAFWPKPARYIVMAIFREDKNATFIINTERIVSGLSRRAKSAAKTAIYKVKIPSGVHFTSFILKESGTRGYRFDPCCMSPANESAKLFHAEFKEALGEVEPFKVSWSGNNALVVDNWKTMHGRSAIMCASGSRELLRIYVE